MIAPDYLKRIASWSRELNEREIEVPRAGIVEKSYRANEFIFMRGDQSDYWTGLVSGLARMGIVSRGVKAASFAGLTARAWLREAIVLENTQEEIGALSGISRQNANQCLKRLEKQGLLRLEYGGVTIIDLERLRHYGE